jgi:hypothetical protein
MRRWRLLLPATFGILLIGCVHRGATSPERGDRYVITAAELERVPEFNLYDVVARLRPHFLRSRTIVADGRPAITPVHLYVDGELMDSIDDLRRVPPSHVREVRFYEPQIANTRFAGSNNAGGVVAVLLKVE